MNKLKREWQDLEEVDHSLEIVQGGVLVEAILLQQLHVAVDVTFLSTYLQLLDGETGQPLHRAVFEHSGTLIHLNHTISTRVSTLLTPRTY